MVLCRGYDGRWRGGGWFVIVFMAYSVKKSYGIRMQGIIARTFSTRLYRKMWEHVA